MEKGNRTFESKEFFMNLELSLEKIPDAPTFATRIPKDGV